MTSPPGGKHDITVKTGEVITVTYRLSASERCRVSTTQNEIYYDSGFFEFVEGSDEAGSGGTGYETGQPAAAAGRVALCVLQHRRHP